MTFAAIWLDRKTPHTMAPPGSVGNCARWPQAEPRRRSPGDFAFDTLVATPLGGEREEGGREADAPICSLDLDPGRRRSARRTDCDLLPDGGSAAARGAP